MCPTVDWAGCPADALPPIKLDRAVGLARPMTAKAYEYWQACRGSRAMPSRKDITPQAMRGFVKHVGLIEVRPGAGVDYFIRVAGAKIEEIFGSITGHLLVDFLPPRIEARWRLVLDAALEGRAPLRATTRVAFAGKTWLNAETLVAPMGEDGEIKMLFAAVEFWPAVAGVHAPA